MPLNNKHKTALLALAYSAALATYAQTPPADGMGPPPSGAQQEETNPPVIDSFGFDGNQKVTTAELMKATTMKTGVKITRALVGSEIQRIVALYQAKGYDLAISPDIQHPADGHVTVTFKIDENGKGGDAGAAPGGNAGNASGPPPAL